MTDKPKIDDPFGLLKRDVVADFVGSGCLLAFIVMMVGLALIPMAFVFWIVSAALHQ